MSESETRPGAVVVLGGPPGAGKTTIAHALVAAWAGPLAHIEGDRFWGFIPRPKSEVRRGDFGILIRSMLVAAVPFARSGYDVLVDFSIPPGFLPAARRIVKELPLAYVVLLPDESVCVARAAGRTEGAVTDYERFRGLYGLFADWAAAGGADRHLLCDGELDAAAVVERILDGLAEGRFTVHPDPEAGGSPKE